MGSVRKQNEYVDNFDNYKKIAIHEKLLFMCNLQDFMCSDAFSRATWRCNSIVECVRVVFHGLSSSMCSSTYENVELVLQRKAPQNLGL